LGALEHHIDLIHAGQFRCKINDAKFRISEIVGRNIGPRVCGCPNYDSYHCEPLNGEWKTTPLPVAEHINSNPIVAPTINSVKKESSYSRKREDSPLKKSS
jgi:hypothetical protein